ncbi:MAG: N-acyl homoserine lactonase family protein [candidate division WOR-3 bacterium]
MLFKLRPVLVGEFGPVREDIKFRGGSPFEKDMVPSYLFYLESSEKRVVVDTGFTEASLQQMGLQGKSEGILCVLEREGVNPESVDLVICTHLHWDHIGNLRAFPKAKIICQRSEIVLALLPPFWEVGYERSLSRCIWEVSDRVVAINGRMSLLDGLSVTRVGGHTPGSQVVEVNTSVGKVIIAGDLIMCFENLDKEWPVGLFWNLEECIEGIQWLKSQKALVLPGHDWRVLDIGSIG